MPHTLFTFRRCPYALRARMALRTAGIDYLAVEVALRYKPAALLACSPKGTVPVMVTDDGQVIEQSLDIMRWALAQHDPACWLRSSEATAHWIDRCEVGFKPLLDRYKYASRHPELSLAEHRERALEAFIRPLEAALIEQDFLSGNQACLADVAVFPFVRQFAGVEPAWFAAAALPRLRAWLNRWLQSELYLTCIAKST
jgi:glutathione S-transferase